MGKRVSPVSMVASAGNAISQNPSRPSQKPYTLPSKLRPEFTWMLPEDGLSFEDRLKEYVSKKELQEGDGITLKNWWLNYREACANSPSKGFAVDEYFALLAELVRKERRRPHYFQGASVETGTHFERSNAHAADSRFFDYQSFGIDFTRPMIDWDNSAVRGADTLQRIKEQLARGENVVFMSNHQSESDTHCLFTLFEDQMGPEYGALARNIVFIAGERVLRDAIVVPFSRGCNLLTVYSKKHIDSEPELKPAKMTHNQRTLKKLGELFYVGGTCMWFAPSGGRDRRSQETGKVELAPFDPNSIEMIRQVAERAGALEKTHFYPMAMATSNIFPPPASVGGAFGEERRVNYGPLRVCVLPELAELTVESGLDGAQERAAVKENRVKRAAMAFDGVREGYTAIGGYDQ